MKKAVAIGVLFLFAAALLTGCGKGTNLLGWMAPTGGSSAADAANGDSQFASGNYSGAMSSYGAAVASNPANSRARYGYVKSYIKNAGMNLADFLQNISSQNSPAYATQAFSAIAGRSASSGYLFFDDPTRPFGINLKSLEEFVNVLIVYLDPIALGQCDGAIPANNVGLNINLAFAHLLKGVFILVDNNNDGTLDYNLRINNGNVEITDPYGNATTSTTFDKTGALAELDTSIARLDVAIANSTNNSATIWVDIRNILVDVRTALAAF
jgi:hypothetical protein